MRVLIAMLVLSTGTLLAGDKKSIYIDDIGPEILQDKLVNLLISSSRFSATEDRGRADYVLSGSAELGSKYVSRGFAKKDTAYAGSTELQTGSVAVRLTDDNGDIVWSMTTDSTGGSSSSRLAKKILKSLEKAAKSGKL